MTETTDHLAPTRTNHVGTGGVNGSVFQLSDAAFYGYATFPESRCSLSKEEEQPESADPDG